MGGGGPEPVPVEQETQNAARMRRAEAPSSRAKPLALLNLKRTTATREQVRASGRICHGIGGRAKGELPPGIALDRALVVTVTVVVAAAEPSIGDEAGETEQVEAIGAPMHDHVIAWLNPPIGAAETEKVADCPAVMDEPDGPAATL